MKYLYIILLLFCFAQCSKTQKTQCGIEYTIIETKHGEQLKAGDFVQIHFNCLTEYDSVLSSSTLVKRPLILQLYPLKEERSEINEAILGLSVGDSALIYPNALDFLTKTMKQTNIPARIKKDSKLRFSVRIIKTLTLQEIADIKKKEEEKLALQEQMLLSEYIRKEGINQKPFPSGLILVELEKGKGKSINRNSKLSISYKGTFVNGLEFSSSERDGEPLKLDMSKDKLIEGWIEALLLMKQGSKAKLIIPSKLAYGANGLKHLVAPFTSLVFEITVLSVE